MEDNLFNRTASEADASAQPVDHAKHAQPEANEVASENAANQNLIDILQKEKAALKDQYVRAVADLENVRRRSAEEIQKSRKFAIEKFAEQLLSVADCLEAALNDKQANLELMREGISSTYNLLINIFNKHNIEICNPQPCDKFDPNLHQAIAAIVSENEPNTIVNTSQKGYLMAGRVLRPAMVAVAKKSEE